MIVGIQLLVPVLFLAALATTLIMFHLAAKGSWKTTAVLVAWAALQALIASTAFYLNTDTVPPRFLLLAGPPMLVILLMFLTPSGRAFVDGLNLKWLTWLHVVRIPVEIVLYRLFLFGYVPELMTFEGRNFDILSGLTAPLVALLCFQKGKVRFPRLLLIWNFLALGLLVNIVVNAVLAAPSPFQQFAFEQPNRGILYMPFNLLPAVIVPLVLLSHLAAIRRLISRKPSPEIIFK